MTPELKKFIKEYVHLPEGELNVIVNKFKRKKIKKNEYLLKAGEVCKDLIFV